MKNIVHIVDSLERGGQETFLVDLAISQKNNGDNPIIICIEKGGILEEKALVNGIPVLIIGSDKPIKKRIKLLGIKIIEQDPYIVHTHNRRPLMFSILGAPSLTGKIINTRHGNAVRGLYWSLAALCSKGIVNVSSDLLVESNWFNRVILNYKNSVIENGIPLSSLSCDGSNIGQLVMVGRLSEVKNHTLALEIMKRCKDKCLPVSLTIIGDGPERNAISEKIEALDLANDVQLLGDRSNVLELLAKSDIFLFTSLSEGHSIALLEACSIGLPAVVSNVGGNREIITDGINGNLIELENIDGFVDSIEALVSNREHWQLNSTNTQEKVAKNFSIDACRKQYDSLYAK